MQQLFSSIILIVLSLLQIPVHADYSAPKILILGDSLSAAYNIPIEKSWPSLFTTNIRSRYPDTSVNNASISGETTFGGLQRLPGLLQRIQPSHLIIELGGNDGLRGLKFLQTTENFNQMVNMAQEKNIEVLLIGIDLPPNLGPVYNQRFQQIFESVATRHNIVYLPRFLDGVAASEEKYMQADGIHPTAIAQPVLATKVEKRMSQILSH